MFRAPDTTMAEVDAPVGGMCASGHVASGTFQGKPIRFFHFTSEKLSGIYCEPCIIVANELVRQKRNKDGIR